VLTRGKADRDGDRRAIVATAREHGATTIVVGLPRSLSGRDGPAARDARAEAEAIAALADDVEVVLQDERLTTVEAERDLRGAGVPADRRRAVVDTVAAALILQSYLDRGVRA
jgi:putative Holliday junction resolvase